ncbi:MAG TPA: hypothetical protein VLV76_00250 [Candidatus Acidoferrum sp.]|nr:hypothetical protein [Candidatus Acidoferrum sp.]
MRDLHKALADIGNIRLQLAAGTMFRGFGPWVIALTGLLALLTAAVQAVWLDARTGAILFLGTWVAVAVVAAVLIGLEMLARTRRHHAGLADAALFNAVEHFVPFGAAGAVIALILLRFAPETVWMLPGLWQMLIGLGLFASLRFLPRAVAIAGAWYFLAGAAALMLAAETRSLSPWAMGVPFGIGQFLLAAILHVAYGDDDVESR